MTPERILVTGGAGFIGTHLVDRLLGDGRRVVCVDSFDPFYSPSEKRANVAPHLDSPRYELVEADIVDRDRMREVTVAFEPDVVVHLAARAGVRPSLDDPSSYQRANVEGTLSVLEAAREAQVDRFVFASSSSVYGHNEKVPFAENDRTARPSSPYAATKIAGEALCAAWAHLYIRSIVSLRFFTVYGARQRPDLAIRKFSEQLLRGETIRLFGDGSTSRDYTYVADIVAGVAAAIDLEQTGHEVLNLGNSSPVTLTDLVAEIERAVGIEAELEWAPEQPGDVPITYADITRARERLGYEPGTSLSEGLGNFVSWLRGRAD